MRTAIIALILFFGSGVLAQEVVTASSEDIQEFDHILAKAKANGANFQPARNLQSNAQNARADSPNRQVVPAPNSAPAQQHRGQPPPPAPHR